MPQLISVPIPDGRLHDAEGRRELLVESDRQLLHAERVPALRRQHHGGRDHGQERREHEVSTGLTAGRHDPARPDCRTSHEPPERRRPPRPSSSWRGITKRYGGVRALEGVDFACRRRLDPRRPRRERRRQVDADQDHLGRRPARHGHDAPRRPRGARSPTRSRPTRAGIVCIFQELSLMPDLSVADNICIADPPRRLGLIDRARPAAPRRGAAGPGRLRGRQPARAGQGPAALAPADGRDRQGARPRAEAPDPRRGHLGADRGRRREGLRHPAPAAATRAWPSSTSRTACTRSRRWPTPARSSATAATSRPSRKGARSEDEIVQLMIGREWAHVYPPKPDARRRARARARGRRAALGRPAERRVALGRQGRDRRPGRPRRPGPAGAAAGAVRRAARASSGEIRVDGRAGHRSAARRRPRAGACGMALIPEDRKTEGLMLPMSVADNLGMAALRQL